MATTKRRVLLLGGTGAIGIYLAPLLEERGYCVDITSRSDRTTHNTSTTCYITGNAHNLAFIESLLKEGAYDVVVDFMVYSTEEFSKRLDILLKNVTQYIYLSSYRVFSNDTIITERSPRLLDVSKDAAYLSTDEYALAKARQEDILRNSGYHNWTIIRPGITYSKERFQLGTLEAETFIWRALSKKVTIFPEELLDKATTMTWSGDVATMISALVLEEKTYGDDFNVASSESHTWREVIAMYTKHIQLRLAMVDTERYIEATQSEYQLKYDRLFDRKIDNSKIAQFVDTSKFMKLEDGLSKELTGFLQKPRFTKINYATQARIDIITHELTMQSSMNTEDMKVYIKERFPRIADGGRLGKRFVRKIRSKARVRTRMQNVLEAAEAFKAGLIEAKDKMRLKKITDHPDGAIITLIDYSNYGNIIQRYALQEFLYKHGHRFVSYEHLLPIASTLEDSKHKNIIPFVERYIATRPFDAKEALPAYITGSDQVWRNWKYKQEVDDLGFFFLNFSQEPNVKRIAYAASFGKSTLKDAGISTAFTKKAAAYLDAFTAISVRERSAVSVIKDEWGKEASLVVDPALLLTASDYNRVISHSEDHSNAIATVFVYVLGPTEDNRLLIERTAASMGVEAEVINPYHTKALPSVTGWLKGIRDAELVITDSFHSTVFSIINNTPFMVIENEYGGIGRVEDLLKALDIDLDRIVRRHSESEYDIQNTKPIDWNHVNTRLSRLRQKSGSWLLEALK